MLWNKTYGGTDREVAYSVLQTDDGGFLLAGYSMSFGAGWGDDWLVETDSKGNLLWNKTYGGIYGDGANSIIQTSDGSFLLAGYTTLPASRSDCWLLKVQIPMIPVISTHDYSEVWHTQDFIINLSSNVPTQVSQTYYTINGGPVKTVSVDGQPKIATDGLNSLEYWTVDTRGSEETPHKTLTNIKLDKTIPEGSLVINTGAASTTSTSVTLTLTYADNGSGINQVRYSNDGAIWSPWESASQSKAWTLNSGDGQKTVYYQISDNAGLASTYLSTINLTAPTQTANPTSYPSFNPTTPPTQKPVTNPTASPTMNPSPIPELPFITVLPLVVIIPLVATAVLRKKKKVSGVTR
jgi:hypothetical protein